MDFYLNGHTHKGFIHRLTISLTLFDSREDEGKESIIYVIKFHFRMASRGDISITTRFRGMLVNS